MPFIITCPVCGPRNVYEFRFGGEDRGPRPFDNETSPEAWYDYVHAFTNAAEPQTEWWFHRDGCGEWITIKRDPRNNLEIKLPREK